MLRSFVPSKIWLGGLVLTAACTALGVAGLKRYTVAPTDAPQSAAVTPAPAHDPVAKGLDEKQRELIWDIEHHGNLLSRHGFQALGSALSRDITLAYIDTRYAERSIRETQMQDLSQRWEQHLAGEATQDREGPATP